MHSDEQLSQAAFLLRSSFWLPDLRALGNNILSNRYSLPGKIRLMLDFFDGDKQVESKAASRF
jgi:hypothetical protein